MARASRYHTNKDDHDEERPRETGTNGRKLEPNAKDLNAFFAWFGNYRELKTYKEVRQDLAWIKWGVVHGLIDTKVANCQVYVMSHVIIALDREREYELADNLAKDLLKDGGEIDLTDEQAARVLQTASPKMQIKLIEQFDNENKLRAQKLDPPDAPIDVPFVDNFMQKVEEKVEEWEF